MKQPNKQEQDILDLMAAGGSDADLLLLERLQAAEQAQTSLGVEIQKAPPEDRRVETLASRIAPKLAMQMAEIAKGEPGKDYVLTEKDKEEIAKSIIVPPAPPAPPQVIVEKTEVIREQPIVTEVHNVTNEVKEVALYETPEEIYAKLQAIGFPMITVSETAPSNPKLNDLWISLS